MEALVRKLKKATRNAVNQTARLVQSEYLDRAAAALAVGEAAENAEALSPLSEAVGLLGRAIAEPGARETLGQSHDSPEYLELVALRDATLSAAFELLRTEPHSGPFAELARNVRDLPTGEPAELLERIWALSSAVEFPAMFSSYDPTPVRAPPAKEASRVLCGDLPNCSLVLFDSRPLFDADHIRSNFPNFFPHAIDSTSIARFAAIATSLPKKLAKPDKRTCALWSLPLADRCYYRIGESFHVLRAPPLPSDHRLAFRLQQSNTLCNRVLEDEILKFMTPSRPRQPRPRMVPSGIVQSVVNELRNTKKEPLLAALGRAAVHNKPSLAAQILPIYRSLAYLESKDPNHIQRALNSRQISRQLARAIADTPTERFEAVKPQRAGIEELPSFFLIQSDAAGSSTARDPLVEWAKDLHVRRDPGSVRKNSERMEAISPFSNKEQDEGPASEEQDSKLEIAGRNNGPAIEEQDDGPAIEPNVVEGVLAIAPNAIFGVEDDGYVQVGFGTEGEKMTAKRPQKRAQSVEDAQTANQPPDAQLVGPVANLDSLF